MLDAWHDAVPPSPPKRVVGYLPQPADYCGFTPRKTQRNESAMNFRVLNADWPPQPLRWDLPPHTSTITIYRDILLSQNVPSGQRRRDVRQGHDGLRGWEKGDGTLREALPPEVHGGVGSWRVVPALRGRSRLPFHPPTFPDLGCSFLPCTGVQGGCEGVDGVQRGPYAGAHG